MQDRRCARDRERGDGHATAATTLTPPRLRRPNWRCATAAKKASKRPRRRGRATRRGSRWTTRRRRRARRSQEGALRRAAAAGRTARRSTRAAGRDAEHRVLHGFVRRGGAGRRRGGRSGEGERRWTPLYRVHCVTSKRRGCCWTARTVDRAREGNARDAAVHRLDATSSCGNCCDKARTTRDKQGWRDAAVA